MLAGIVLKRNFANLLGVKIQLQKLEMMFGLEKAPLLKVGWAGNPAHLICKQFENSIINCLKGSERWNKSEEIIQKAALYYKKSIKSLNKLKENVCENTTFMFSELLCR